MVIGITEEAPERGVVLLSRRAVRSLGIDFSFGLVCGKPARLTRSGKVRGRPETKYSARRWRAYKPFSETVCEPLGMYGVAIEGINERELWKMRGLASGDLPAEAPERGKTSD